MLPSRFMAAPPTLIDGPSPLKNTGRRPGRKWRNVLAIFFFFVAILGVGAVAAYWTLVRYEPVAHRHVPSGSAMAARIDFQEIALFGPVRRHLWPLVFERGEPNDSGSAATVASRIEAATGLTLGRDIREVVLVSYGATDSGRWIVIFGGKIPHGIVRGLQKLATEENVAAELSPNGDVLTWRALGIAIGQAKDRSLIVASDPATLALALPAQDGASAIGLPETGAFAFAIAASAWNEWGSGMAGAVIPGVRSLTRLHGCNGRFGLGANPELEMQCRLAQGVDAEQVRSSLLGLATMMRGASALSGSSDMLGEQKALADLRIEAFPDGRLRIVAPWPLEGLERGAQTMATKVRGFRMLTGTAR